MPRSLRKTMLGGMAAAAVAMALSLPAQAWWSGPHVHGNDAGGIIPWSPEVQHLYRDLAASHCARWNKIAVISSVHRIYGDYVGFRCHFPPGYDPIKARYGTVSARG